MDDRTPLIADPRDRIARMSDGALNTLHTNAVRLVETGNERQRASADALMPLIEQELAVRHGKGHPRREPARETRHPAVPKPDPLPEPAAHKFGIGQSVRLCRTLYGTAIDGMIYEIVRLLPSEQNEFQYRIRTADGRTERAVLESQLAPAAPR